MDGRRIYIENFKKPVIKKIISSAGAGAPIIAGQDLDLVICGESLKGKHTFVKIADSSLTPTSITNNEIRVFLSNIAIRAGIYGVQVIHGVEMGDPPNPRPCFESNAVVIHIRPLIANIKQTRGKLAITAGSVIGIKQDVSVLLNRVGAVKEAAELTSYRISSPLRYEESNTVEIETYGISPGKYFARLEIDGAASLLDETDGKYSGPLIELA